MTAGNQGAAYDKAVAALKLDPTNRTLQARVAVAKGKLNESLEAKGQRPVS